MLKKLSDYFLVISMMLKYCEFLDSIAYEFGPGRGLITYTFPENQKPETTEDTLALAFITTKDDAVLFRVDSSTSNDYIELEMVIIFSVIA